MARAVLTNARIDNLIKPGKSTGDLQPYGAIASAAREVTRKIVKTETREIPKFTSEFFAGNCLRLGLTFGLVRGMPIGTSLL